ncbi:hypothetical protein ACIRP7_41965 [Streptomyces sp. NPDC102270]|uniref:hypothetical protein n=1 Tax=Streptomyces sp. NPDC102270 TaxID=3366150 RepID=UPI0038179A55
MPHGTLSPALAQSAHAFGDHLRTDLYTRVPGRVPRGDTLIATLRLNLALTASMTAVAHPPRAAEY